MKPKNYQELIVWQRAMDLLRTYISSRKIFRAKNYTL